MFGWDLMVVRNGSYGVMFHSVLDFCVVVGGIGSFFTVV